MATCGQLWIILVSYVPKIGLISEKTCVYREPKNWSIRICGQSETTEYACGRLKLNSGDKTRKNIHMGK